MSAVPSIPGLYYTFVRPQSPLSAVRTDIAGLFGRTVRGPAGQAVRVVGWREYQSIFGGLTADAMTSYAVKSYFDNEAEVAYIVRLLGAGSTCAGALWQAGQFDPVTASLNPDWPGASGLTAIAFAVQASSPGEWANDTTVDISYWATGGSAQPELQFLSTPRGEDPELLSGISPQLAVQQVNAQSSYIRLTPQPLPAGLAPSDLAMPAGPRYFEWLSLNLGGGTQVPPAKADYVAAVLLMSAQREVALLACPDLYHPQFSDPHEQAAVLQLMLAEADALHDRLIVIDVPPAKAAAADAAGWVDQTLRQMLQDSSLRNGAVYHPRLLVPDPLGVDESAVRCTPCSGAVTGVISRQDVRLGAYFTPANTPIEQAVDLSTPLTANDQAIIYSGGLNLLTCSPGRGLLVWGGRVLGKGTPPGGFVAHRRLIHLLVRAIRQVAEPLVFDTNGPELWLAFVRSITTVLLEAYRAGALQGDRPDQAFTVTCDATTNPPAQVDQGMVVCLVQVAPAVPMEFITLRVSVSAQGQLEVFES